MSWQEYEFFSTQILSFILLHETDLEQCAICTSTAVIVIKLLCDVIVPIYYYSIIL